ncbi:MAG: tRNA-specific adenosine deaminase [Bacteroidetes bacterium GWE2_29_8]|nr:MAG: tRNA-specific adenosine deaminase [Bacteroidetes bacterium GWE2_29_8]
MQNIFSDEYFMREAIKEAKKALEEDEVPIGAIIVSENIIIARAYNMTEKLKDFTAHAEMLAFTSAVEYLGNKYLDKCKLYVTLEPCVMCAGAAYWNKISEIIYAASDPKRGFTMYNKPIIHPKTILKSGILKEEAEMLIMKFFKNKR